MGKSLLLGFGFDVQKVFLHVGCGKVTQGSIRGFYDEDKWTEIRYDIDPSTNPDITGTIEDMSMIHDNSVEALYSSHNIEHLHLYQLKRALREFHRVIKDDGFVVIVCPDFMSVVNFMSKEGNDLDSTIYVAPCGEVRPIDFIFGLQRAIELGNEFMAHKTALTRGLLQRLLIEAGFIGVHVVSDGSNLWAVAIKTLELNEEFVLDKSAKKIIENTEHRILLKLAATYFGPKNSSPPPRLSPCLPLLLWAKLTLLF